MQSSSTTPDTDIAEYLASIARVDLRPIGKVVIAQAVLADEKTEGGLYIPERARKTYDRARIVAVGTKSDLGLRAGDLVMYERGLGTPFKHEGQEFLRIADEYLLAVISLEADTQASDITTSAGNGWSAHDGVMDADAYT